MLDRYLAQVRLLLGVLPAITRETTFALKGGTAPRIRMVGVPNGADGGCPVGLDGSGRVVGHYVDGHTMLQPGLRGDQYLVEAAC